MNLLEMFQDPDITDLLVDSNRTIQVIKKGQLITRAEFFADDKELQDLAKSLIRDAGGRIDLARPFADVNMKSEFGQLRVHALLGNECSNGTQLSIRRHPTEPISLQQLLEIGSITSFQLSQLQELIDNKRNFVIVGATGSGKTTLLRAMLNQAPCQRLITIEDNAELKITNAIELFTRQANTDGYGEISMQQLVREALRMRPDRLAIGEARGIELATLVQALNTGHNGVGFTLHANGIQQGITRMQAFLAVAGIESQLAALMISSSIDYAIELSATDRKVIAIEKVSI